MTIISTGPFVFDELRSGSEKALNKSTKKIKNGAKKTNRGSNPNVGKHSLCLSVQLASQNNCP